jgi:hypothetical protein
LALTGRQEEAAALLAADRLSDDKIADQLGIVRRTLANWKLLEEFAVRVATLRTEIRERIRSHGIAIVEERVRRLDETRTALLAIVAARGEAHAGEAPGAETGYLVRQVKLVKVYDAGEAEDDVDEELEPQPHGGALKRRRSRADVLESLKQSVEVVEFALDTGLVKALADVEKQAAQELGQWIDRKKVEATGQIAITEIEVVMPEDDDE